MLSGPSALCDDAIERLGAATHVSDGVGLIEGLSAEFIG